MEAGIDIQNIVVETINGKIKGIQRNGLFEFKGIPFAAPPVGERRWLPPAPVLPWSNILDATAFRPAAPQNNRSAGTLRTPGFDAIESQSEDCLFLNICTPGNDTQKRPVLVWIHGGGFIFGSGSQPTYWGDILAKCGDVVVVTINYRMGLLGFLNLNEVTGGRIPATGNEGLLDQIAALRWVRKNISNFGGDPDNVTVFGESSGAMSIGCLMAMPKAKGMFQKAILESGTGKMARPLSVSLETSRQFLQALGLKGEDTKSLRALSAERILAIQQELALKAPGGITPTAPVIDGRVLPGTPLEVVRSGSGVNVPILIGNNLDENKIAYLRQPGMQEMDEAALIRLCQTIVPAQQVSRLIEIYRQARTQRSAPINPHEIFSAIRADAMFRVPSVQLAQACAQNGQAAYNYLFTWKSPAMGGILGACHALEISFVFGRPDPVFSGSGPAVDDLSRKIQDAWLAFARTGNPSCKSLGKWLPYGQERRTMLLGEKCGLVESIFDDERRIWDEIDESGPV